MGKRNITILICALTFLSLTAVIVTTYVVQRAAGASYENANVNNIEQVPPGTAIEKASHPKMQQALYQLAKSKNPRAFAEEKGIAMIEDKVRVIIILANEGNISGRLNIIIEERDKNLVQALVPVSALLDIANESDVNYIKVPEEFVPMKEEKSKRISFPSIFSWTALLVIFLLIKIRRRK